MVNSRFVTGEGGRGRVIRTVAVDCFNVKLHVGGTLRNVPAAGITQALPSPARNLRAGRSPLIQIVTDAEEVTNLALWDYLVPPATAKKIDNLINTTRAVESTPAVFTARDLFLTRGPNTRMLRPRLRTLFACPTTFGIIIRFKRQPLIKIVQLQAGERGLVASRNIGSEEILGAFETWGPALPLGRGGHSVVHFPHTANWATNGMPQEHDTAFGSLSFIWLGNSSRGLAGVAETRRPNASIYAPSTTIGPTGVPVSKGVEWASRGSLPKTPVLCLLAQGNGENDKGSSTAPAIRSGQEILWDYAWQPTRLAPPRETVPTLDHHDPTHQTQQQNLIQAELANRQDIPGKERDVGRQIVESDKPGPMRKQGPLAAPTQDDDLTDALEQPKNSVDQLYLGDLFHVLPQSYSKQLDLLKHLTMSLPDMSTACVVGNLCSGKAERVSGADLRSFQPQEWVNATALNGFLQLLARRNNSRLTSRGNQAPSVHIMSTYFQTRLTQPIPNILTSKAQPILHCSRAEASDAYFLSTLVINITATLPYSNFNPLASELIIIPNHMNGNHWTLTVVRVKLRQVWYFDSIPSGRHIFRLHTRQVIQWLKQAFKSDPAQYAWANSEWLEFCAPAPEQFNNVDCGIFVLAAARAVLNEHDPRLNYDQREVDTLRTQFSLELLSGSVEWGVQHSTNRNANVAYWFPQKTTRLRPSHPVVEGRRSTVPRCRKQGHKAFSMPGELEACRVFRQATFHKPGVWFDDTTCSEFMDPSRINWRRACILRRVIKRQLLSLTPLISATSWLKTQWEGHVDTSPPSLPILNLLLATQVVVDESSGLRQSCLIFSYGKRAGGIRRGLLLDGKFLRWCNRCNQDNPNGTQLYTQELLHGGNPLDQSLPVGKTTWSHPLDPGHPIGGLKNDTRVRVHHFGLRENISISAIELKLAALSFCGENGLHQPPVLPFRITTTMATAARQLAPKDHILVAWRQPRSVNDDMDGESLEVRRAIFLGFSEDSSIVHYFSVLPENAEDPGVHGNGFLLDTQGNLIGLRGDSPLTQAQRLYLQQEAPDDDWEATAPPGTLESGTSIFLLLEALERWADNGPRVNTEETKP